RLEATDERLDRLRAFRDARLPFGIVERDLRPQLLTKDVLLGEEELELQEVAEPERLAPELGDGIGDVGLRGAEQRELRDRAVHEEVDDRVPVVRADEVLVGSDRVDGLEAARVDRDDAVLDERRE